MTRLLSRGVVFMAGVVSLPPAVTPPVAQTTSTPERRTDPRLDTLRRFFRRFDCPALQYAHVFLEAADHYALDWRLLPSISYVESTGGKMARNNNIFGWDSGRAKFPTPASGIHTVAYRLTHSDRYRDKDLNEKLATYNATPGYARKVRSVMRRIAPSE